MRRSPRPMRQSERTARRRLPSGSHRRSVAQSVPDTHPGRATMPTRRKLLSDTPWACAGVTLAGPLLRSLPTEAAISDLQRNAAVVRRFKEAQGTKDEADAMREVLSPGYKRWRGGIEHLAANARDQGFPGPGS